MDYWGYGISRIRVKRTHNLSLRNNTWVEKGIQKDLHVPLVRNVTNMG